MAVQRLIDNQMQEQVLGGAKKEKIPKRFEGMNPDVTDCPLVFDSAFECDNLDRVIMVTETEYDLYMRPDTNTRGHHQWFYFKV